MLLMAIWIAESYLREHTGLFFRGGITKGLYYHENDIAFGPAIVASYQLENKANYSRILVEKECVVDLEDEPGFFFMEDFDGQYCFNPYSIGLSGNLSRDKKFEKSEMVESIKKERKILCKIIESNFHTSVSEKYLWRILPFNNICNLLTNICRELQLDYTEDEIEEWKKLNISIKEFEMGQ